jgi:hypothetical protein
MLSGFDIRECLMNVGKTLFAQVMEFVPWKTFRACLRSSEQQSEEGQVDHLHAGIEFAFAVFP